jgi:hypothetical protein
MADIFDPAATALSAIQNVSRIPAHKSNLRHILETGEGEPAHVHVIFNELDLITLMKLAIAFDISDPTLVKAYLHARKRYAVFNTELEEIARQLRLSAERLRLGDEPDQSKCDRAAR